MGYRVPPPPPMPLVRLVVTPAARPILEDLERDLLAAALTPSEVNRRVVEVAREMGVVVPRTWPPPSAFDPVTDGWTSGDNRAVPSHYDPDLLDFVPK